jgi:hypothetical protein
MVNSEYEQMTRESKNRLVKYIGIRAAVTIGVLVTALSIAECSRKTVNYNQQLEKNGNYRIDTFNREE